MTAVEKSEEHMAAASEAEQRFHRRLRLFGLQWLLFYIVALTIADYIVLSASPSYFHDWRAVTIILLSLLLLLVQGFHFGRMWLRLERRWPPARPYALILWACCYLICLALACIDRGLAWDYWLVFGLCFSIFELPFLVWPLLCSLLTFLLLSGVFHWPLELNDLGVLGGLLLSLSSAVISALTIARLFREQERNARLLQELAQAHSELEEAHQRLALSAAQEQELAVLRERTRLAREMHDTLGHALTLVSVKLEVLRRLVGRDPQRCEREIVETLQVTREAMSGLRASIANLRSPVLLQGSLRQAITSIAQRRAARCGWSLELDLPPELEHLPGDRQEALLKIIETLLKIIQEALTNIEKHAQATRVWLRLRTEAGRLQLTLADNGVGLPLEVQAQLAACSRDEAPVASDSLFVPLTDAGSGPGHYGLIGMRERVHELGGELHLSCPADGGCRLHVSIPLIEAPRDTARDRAREEHEEVDR
ncbi:sensor histidine kinase [Thermogemmatispora onikobensis]|uniref:sensor histidine kinase n=1 Tax=Thermogemmatispora onikobensis TaxID=732234 RepID=UPI000853D377|nr:sensor histidine kinase [Thermogemmatispora onikobensis]